MALEATHLASWAAYHLMYDSRYDWNYLRTHRRLRQGSIGKALAQWQS
jgi:hypothetical protein